MTWIIVQRGNGEFRGPPIEDVLITEDYVAIECGRNALDNAAVGTEEVTLTTSYRVGVRTGRIVRVLDALQGVPWFGKITGIRHMQVSAVELQTVLNIERVDQ